MRIDGRTVVECACSCGRMVRVRKSNLENGNTSSCGCLRKELQSERNTTHGQSRSPEYRIWESMRRRCTDPKTVGFENYGGRGITVCERWRTSFEAFFEDMGRRPSARHTIDRLDSNGNYEPGNCEWRTMIEQQNNKRNNRTITFNGETLTLAQWERKLNIRRGALGMRLRRGWSEEKALTEPYAPRRKAI
jgi:hypothetical protein